MSSCNSPKRNTRHTVINDVVSEANHVANVRIFVEKPIARLKWFLMLKNEIPLLEMPLLDDILIVCSALCNLFPPLCQ